MSQADNSPTVPGAYILLLTEVLARWKIKPEELFEGTTLSLSELTNPLSRLSIRTFEELLKRAIYLTGEPGIGFHLGLQMKISSHGFIGFAAMTANNVREALEIAQRFVMLRSSALEFRLEEDDKKAYFYMDQAMDDYPLSQTIVTAMMIGFASMGETITNRPAIGQAQVRFTEPDYYERFKSSIPGEVIFNQPFNRLVFDRDFLDMPLAMADPVAAQLAREQCERELAALGSNRSLVSAVQSALYDDKEGYRSVEQVASLMHMSERTLKRQLAQHGTTYSDLLESSRRKMAENLLSKNELSIDRVADRLGYSDVANFTRAFKRWTGKTPGQFRKQAKASA